MFLLSLVAAPVLAGTIDAWSAADFSRDGGEVAGTGGWAAGWNDDPWFGYRLDDGNNWASPWYDYSDTGSFGDGGPHDNWIVNEAVPVVQGVFSFSAYVTDNDAWGIVFGHASSKNFLLVLVCGVEGGGTNNVCPTDVVEAPSTALLSVKSGEIEVLGTSRQTLSEGDYGEGQVSINDGEIHFQWGDIDITAAAPDDTMLTGVGFYAYNEGLYTEYGEEDGDTAWFTGPSVAQYDDDDDGVPDDIDNCEKIDNSDQLDADADGIGTACDDSEASGPGDSGTTDSGDTGNGDGNGNDYAEGGTVELTAPGECSCGVAQPGVQAVGLGLVAALTARRRRKG